MASSCTPSAQSSVVNLVTDEKFEEIYRPNDAAIQIADNGRVCENVRTGSFGCALGKNSYGCGIHCIRLKTFGVAIFLGIRSRDVLPVPSEWAGGRYDNSPSTYGWYRDHGRICNGNFKVRDLPRIDRDDDVFTLTLNCDDHRLSIINENTKEQGDLEVDILHAPLPWCIFVQLPRSRARIMLV